MTSRTSNIIELISVEKVENASASNLTRELGFMVSSWLTAIGITRPCSQNCRAKHCKTFLERCYLLGYCKVFTQDVIAEFSKHWNKIVNKCCLFIYFYYLCNVVLSLTFYDK